MRTTLAVAAGLVAVASAKTYTETATVDVTVTSCGPKYTNCPAKSSAADGASASVVWEDWSSDADKGSGTWPAGPATTTAPGKWPPASTADNNGAWPKPSEPAASSDIWEDWESTITVTGTASGSKGGEWPAKSTGSAPGGGDNKGEWSTKSGGAWGPDSVTSGSATGVWSTKTGGADWPAKSSDAAACPAYTATAPPSWFDYLPEDEHKAMEAKWSGAPPADWCYYTYSSAGWSTAATPATSAGWPAGSSPAGGAGASKTGQWDSGMATKSGPVIAQWTGAAVANVGSFVAAGLAAVAAMVVV